MTDFKRLPKHHLERLSDEALVEYVAAARAAGDGAAAKEAMEILAYGWEDRIRAWAAAKVPAQDVDDVVVEAQMSITNAGFDGKVIGQFGAFVRTITQRRIADYYRVAERHGPTEQIEVGRESDDEATHQVSVQDETGYVDLIEVVKIVLADQSPLHQKVIRLYGPDVAGFENLPAGEVKARIEADGSGDTVSVDNVAKIWSRFRLEVVKRTDG